MIPVCTGPVPIASMIRSATASPTATPKTHSAARLKVCPATAPIEITAAIAATNGRSCPNTNVAADQAKVAATAVCTTGQTPARNRLSARSVSRRAAENPSSRATATTLEIAITPPFERVRLNYVLNAYINDHSNILFAVNKRFDRTFEVCCQTVAESLPNVAKLVLGAGSSPGRSTFARLWVEPGCPSQ